MKKTHILVVLLLALLVPGLFAQNFVKRGDIYAGVASPTQKAKVEEITITIGENEYYRNMPQDLEAAQELIRQLTKNFERVSNLTIQYSEKHLEQIESMISGTDTIIEELKPVKENTDDLKKQIAILERNQAKFFGFGFFATGSQPIASIDWDLAFGPMINLNLFNTFLIGAGGGINISQEGIKPALNLQFTFWK